ncbi:hypothetical protein M427DRAFT_64293 [Gonapodya prolifera JEL478]|uniref:Type 1 phosphatases regulator n=1 Tax=Gonapodya prolifera (strain JEL478) TaxID=1344416 RepID=A0A138ZXU8_GONPJ|nr:hypothetical protein M427DRAFT_64293 [Gonapodya prolifera JEL478]|eukprot:KXS09324.1 hypothetical protein M427DRAFT_64293 [Gonapodya prolifera JEL478]
MASQMHTSTATARTGTPSVTVTQTATDAQAETPAVPVGTLHLTARESGRNVRWDQKVKDNEGMGRKKSKICCIYHPAWTPDQGSDTESSSGEDDPSKPNAYERQPKYKSTKKKHHGHGHGHDHDHGDGHHGHDHGDGGASGDKGKEKA